MRGVASGDGRQRSGAGYEPIRIVCGPTASGKTARAIDIALRIGGEVVSADSRQIFAGMDIATATPTLAERRGVPHHLLSERDPGEGVYSAGAFVRDAEARIGDILRRGAVPIVAGGTAFYLKALRDGLSQIPAVPIEVRDAVSQEHRESGLSALVDELRRVDAELAGKIDLANPARVVRGVEVFRSTGRPLSAWQREPPPPPQYRYEVEHLSPEPAELRRRIDARVNAMDAAGLFAEVVGLLEAGHSPALAPMRTIGYAEVAKHIGSGGAAYGRHWEQILADIARHTWQYARRQQTFFRQFVLLQ